MCRLLAYISPTPVTLETAVGGNLEHFLNLSIKHGDGWGIARVKQNDGEACVDRMPERAFDSATLKTLARTTAADGATLHLRWATPGLPIRPENTHPFVRGRYAFMHNGAISNAIDAIIPQDARHVLEGDTDSEKYFLVALGCMERLGPFDGMVQAVQTIVAACDYTSLNSMLLTPDELIVVSHYRPERIPADESPDYYEIRYKLEIDRLVVASTGWPQEGWTRLPNRSVSRFDRQSLMLSAQHLT
jgi:predicted glutamine amidotransferase